MILSARKSDVRTALRKKGAKGEKKERRKGYLLLKPGRDDNLNKKKQEESSERGKFEKKKGILER